MIKVGITGCDNVRAAELVRVLLNHPDVELVWATRASGGAVRLDEVVPGIIGDSDLVVNEGGKHDVADVVFTCDPRDLQSRVLSNLELPDETRVIDLSGNHNLDHGEGKPWTYGLSEMQRRVLVHEARMVTVPGNAAVASLIALMPMARNQMLNSPLTVNVAVGPLGFPCVDGGRALTLDGMDAGQWVEEQRREVALALRQCQPGFDQPVEMSFAPLAERRTLAVDVCFSCGMDLEMVRQLYEQYYSDHHFVFMVDRPIVTADVENTNKCLMRIEKDAANGLLTIHAMMDVLLKGNAGTAVHVMNLLFGLHERVGLTLKATGC